MLANPSWTTENGVWDNLLAAASLAFAAYGLVCFLKPKRFTETVLFFFPVSAALVVVWAYLLSALHKLADLGAWALAGAATAALSGAALFLFKPGAIPLGKYVSQSAKETAAWFAATDGWQKLILVSMGLAALFASALNLTLVLFAAPHTWDALTYHLPRMAYYLQRGDFSFFGANYWAQAIHPKNSTALLIYVFLVSGRSDSLTQILEYLSHGVFVLSVYGISLKAGLDKTQSVFAALTGALLIPGIELAASAQNDLFIAACFGVAVYSLLAFRETPRRAYLFAAALALALSLGAKASSALALPSFALVALWALFYQAQTKRALRSLVWLGAFTLAASVFLVLPSGYLDNYKYLGHPVGPEKVRRMHSFEGQSAADFLPAGGYNLLRFGFDFLALDGLPRAAAVKEAERLLRLPLRILTSRLDLESDFAEGFSPFRYENDKAVYWGVLGFGAVWLAAARTLFRPKRNRAMFVLALAAFAFLIIQAFSGPYDSARGRYFMICAVFAVPSVGGWISTQSRALRVYLALLALAGSLSAVAAVSAKAPLLNMNRDEQFSFTYRPYYEKIKAFDFLVPKDAVVAAYLYPNTFEYPLFGRGLTRVLLPINSFSQGLQPIPARAQYLLYAKGYPCPLESDRHLKGDWFLRKLDETNRACKFP